MRWRAAAAVVALAAAQVVASARLLASPSPPGGGVSQEVPWRPASAGAGAPAALPVVLWHGMGDSCCSNHSIGAITASIQSALPGTYVHSIATGEIASSDVESSFFGNVNQQVENVCSDLAAISELKDGFNAIGFSQGGQFLRAVAQRCSHSGPPMRTLVTVGAQHQGIMNVPSCWNPSVNATPTYVCSLAQRFIGWGAYLPYIRDHVVQAQYFKDPYHLPTYLRLNTFLPDINNEREVKNAQYRKNLAALDRLVLFQFADDTTVVPRSSAHFGFYDGTRLLRMQDTPLYQEDWIGLRALDEAGKLVLADIPGRHMHISLQWLKTHVVQKYLAG